MEINHKIKLVLGAEANRDILNFIIQSGKIYKPILVPGDPITTAYYSGKRDLALEILKLAVKEEEPSLTEFTNHINFN